MEEQTPKTKNFIPILIVVVVLLAAAVIFLIVRPYVGEQEPVDNSIVITEITATPTETAEPEVSPTVTTQPAAADHKSDIDKDLVSLDSLDLSTAENDFSDDKLSDL